MLQLQQKCFQTAQRFPQLIAVYDKATMADYTYSKMLIASFMRKEDIPIMASGKVNCRDIEIVVNDSLAKEKI